MNRRLRFAALLPLLLLASRASAEDPAPPVPAPAPQDIPKAAPRTPLPPEPKDTGKKAIQAIVKRWFEHEPKAPPKGHSETECKSERAKAASDLETELIKWPNCLRLTAWWKARLEETQPSANVPTGILPKVEFTYNGKSYTFAASIPKTYRGNGTDLLPVIITVIDKGADAKKVLTEAYGKLLDTHIVVAGYEDKIPNAGTMTVQIFYAYLTYHCDRDRVALDGIGKGARFVEALATEDYSALQWNGVVIRNPSAVQALEGNLGLFPVGVVEPGTAAGAPAIDAAQAHVKAGGPGTLIPAGDAAKVQAFVAGLPPRKVADQKNGCEMWFKSLGHMPKWGYWYLLKQSVDGGKDLPVRVKISRDAEYNAVDIDATNLAEGVLLLNDDVLDLEQPVAVRVNGILVAREKVGRFSKETFAWDGGYASLHLGPRNYFIVAALPFVVPEGEARIPKADRDAAAAAEKKAAEDRKKQEDADAAAKAAEAKAAEDAKNPKPEPGPGENPPVPVPATDGTKYFGTIDEAKAAARGRPILVIFQAPRADTRQQALDVAFASEEVKKALAAVDVVLVPPAEAGDAGKATRDLLSATSGAADTAAPFLAIFGVKATLALSSLKEEEIQAAVLKLLAGIAQPAPTVQEAPTPIEWGSDYEAGRKAALEKKVPLVVHFQAGPPLSDGQKDAQTSLDGLLKDHPGATKLLAKAVCVRLDVGGADKEKILAVLATVASDRTAPCLWCVKVTESETKELVNSPLGLLDPVNLPKEKIAEKLVTLLGEWGLGDGKPATGATPATPEEKKPEEKKPEEKKPDAPKPADPK